MKRREFITLLGGAATAMPLVARAQQAGKVPTIGILGPTTLAAQPQWTTGFLQRLRALGWTSVHRTLIITLAAKHQLPTIYPFRFFAVNGGLISYGADTLEPYRRAAGYVDRILKGEKPGDLPVQAPTKFELVINLKTAKALGIDVPTSVLARADEVIE
jgi:hypothetical protein